jgi:hypothetical protein
VVGIATKIRYGIQIPVGARAFSLLLNVQNRSDAQTASYSTVLWFSPEVKRAGLEVNHLPLSTAKVTNEWSYISASPICFHGVEKENYLLESFCGPQATTYTLILSCPV